MHSHASSIFQLFQFSETSDLSHESLSEITVSKLPPLPTLQWQKSNRNIVKSDWKLSNRVELGDTRKDLCSDRDWQHLFETSDTPSPREKLLISRTNAPPFRWSSRSPSPCYAQMGDPLVFIPDDPEWTGSQGRRVRKFTKFFSAGFQASSALKQRKLNFMHPPLRPHFDYGLTWSFVDPKTRDKSMIENDLICQSKPSH